jgi:hypothetical protein
MLDSSWARYREFLHLHDQVRSAGGIVVTAVYDLLPITLPRTTSSTADRLGSRIG